MRERAAHARRQSHRLQPVTYELSSPSARTSSRSPGQTMETEGSQLTMGFGRRCSIRASSRKDSISVRISSSLSVLTPSSLWAHAPDLERCWFHTGRARITKDRLDTHASWFAKQDTLSRQRLDCRTLTCVTQPKLYIYFLMNNVNYYNLNLYIFEKKRDIHRV